MSWNALVFASSGLVSAVMTNARDNSNNVARKLILQTQLEPILELSNQILAIALPTHPSRPRRAS